MDRLTRIQPINKILKMQVVGLVLTVIVFSLWQGFGMAIAGAYGAAIGIANTLLQKRHLVVAAHEAKSDAAMNLRKAYRCVAERWILTIAMFSVGFIVLKFSALAVLVGFIVTQLVLFLGNMNRS
ncbi:ATP synthase subunit I [Methylophaga sp. OBS4]|uniref:ATP synthase subunit I n=1 Tax=Methylophaga sp. OBS4 TaxID=2991935 RepID=UPI00224F6B1C|nr:ATP synthase subunit I [Methylophaga sp. OBS4]MCX4186597.1 ATP synthase subunit I [Methylophaga sp. OBS4]